MNLSHSQLTGPIWLMQPIPYFGENLPPEEWVYEPKIDGWRMQIIKYRNGKTECWGRRLERKPNWTEKLRSLVELAHDFLPAGTLLDTELYSTGGRRFVPSLFASTNKAQPLVYVFDVIFWQGKFVGDLPLFKRQQFLRELKFSAPFALLESHPVHDLHACMKSALEKGHEGIVVKKLSSPYEVGQEAPLATMNWRKIKPQLSSRRSSWQ